MNNEERFYEIKRIIRDYYYHAKNNSNYISRNYIRKSITRYNISDSDKNVDLKDYFP